MNPSRKCVCCSRHVNERKPVYLFLDDRGRIVGPLHAACAAAVAQAPEHYAAILGTRVALVGQQLELDFKDEVTR